MLTNFFPNDGNGVFKIHAIAEDIEGHQFPLGFKTITVDNANAVKPFGALDTPNQGGTASGSDFINWGWVLTPQPNIIPTDGSTIKVWVDGINLGHPTYNIYRSDIATKFPGYANSDGAVGYFYIDTTTYENGLHTIQWTATDSGGNTDGIGSRYFNILNTSQPDSQGLDMSQISAIPSDTSEPLAISTGYNDYQALTQILPGKDGIVKIKAWELDRIKIKLPGKVLSIQGFQLVDNRPSHLPAGFTLDARSGTILWQMGVGFSGTYNYLFVVTDLKGERIKRRITVQVSPKLNRPILKQ
jgi:hypothetical protein